MRKTTKIWLAVAAFLVVLGLVVVAAVMTVNHWDFTGLSTEKYETNTHEISEPFHSLSVKTDTADIVFAVSVHEKCEVVCYEEETSKHLVTVENGTLVIEVIDNKSWHDHIAICINFTIPCFVCYRKILTYISDSVSFYMKFAFKNVTSFFHR